MSTISSYLKMSYSELEEEINKQSKKIAAAKETISLLKKLQIAANATSADAQRAPQQQQQSHSSQNIIPRN